MRFVNFHLNCATVITVINYFFYEYGSELWNKNKICTKKNLKNNTVFFFIYIKYEFIWKLI